MNGAMERVTRRGGIVRWWVAGIFGAGVALAAASPVPAGDGAPATMAAPGAERGPMVPAVDPEGDLGEIRAWVNGLRPDEMDDAAARAALRAAAPLLLSPDVHRQMEGLEVAHRLGERGALALVGVRRLLPSTDQAIALRATQVLGRLGPAGARALPAIVAQARRRDSVYLDVAVDAAGTMGPDAVPALVEALGDPSPAARELGAAGLGKLGAGARDAVPALEALADADDARTRLWGLRALSRIDGEAALRMAPRLEGLRDDPDPEIRRAAHVALAEVDAERWPPKVGTTMTLQATPMPPGDRPGAPGTAP